MSRIHEALKKAEQERSTIAGSEHAPALPASMLPDLPESILESAGTNASEAGVSSLGFEPTITAVGSAPIEYLRFDDLRKRCPHPEWRPDPNVNVFANPDLSKHGAEQFRTLRSRLYQARNHQPLRSLLVTSSMPGEGKTFVSVNLAQAIVRQPDRRAVIIDADLRCARVHTLLGAPQAPGLTDYLRGETDELGIIQFGPDGSLCLVPGGNEVTNPSELLSNGRLGTLIERLAPVFDWIILDSPPCLPVADASILAGICDSVLLVVKAGSTPAATAQRARQELQTRNIIGVVLNAVGEAHMNSEYYHAYRYGYGAQRSSKTEA